MEAATSASAPARAQDEFNPETHVYEPHKVGLPPLVPYVRELWRRRQFALELARTTLRAQHFSTVLGQLWLVLNPLLLTCVYFLLVNILRGHSRGTVFFAHLMLGLFAFHFISQSLTQSARSVTKGGRLVLNTAFPRTLLPLSAVITGFLRFLPTMAVYAVMHVIAGRPFGFHLLLALPVLALLALFCMGVCSLVAALQVYFRDVANFLPYFNRIWMYSTPVLYYYGEVPEKLRHFIDLNPLTPLFAMWSQVIIEGHVPSLKFWIWGGAWAIAAFIIGTLFFISRERDFAVRL